MDSKTTEQKKLVKEIGEIKKNILQKHLALTQNIIDVEQQMEESLKPITKPLKQLVEKKQKKPKDVVNTEDVEMDNLQERLKNKRPLEDLTLHEGEIVKRPAIETVDSNPDMQTEELPELNNETVYESLPSVQEVLSTPEGRKSAEYYINSLFKGMLVKRYMRKFFDDEGHEIDHVFGPYYGTNNVLMLGREPIEFDNDNIVINNITYEGTPGLYELVFMKRPDSYIYTEADLRTYSNILKSTKTHIHFPTGRIKSSKSIKYNTIIKPIVASYQFKTQQYWWDDIGGRGLMKVTNAIPNYIYWDNVNELCGRLQLLIASQNSGHTGHENEILSIIEELHEAGIINEDASMIRSTFGK